ncbi:MAG: DUF92 domain-containing protein [Anaerolineae bacterium]|nr:DUF92 domain-containing protein [Anaerolineae bacterium]
MTLTSLGLGFVLALIIAALAYWRGALAPSGALGALVVGTLVFASGGLAWAVLLIAFFVTSSALSHYKARAKEPLAEKFQKGHRRDLGQVLANGGWGALLALAYAFAPHPILFVAFAGAMATVNADTWATELGVLSKTPPRLITTGRVVPVGTSGGITSLGTFVAFAGALTIGILALLSSFVFPPSSFVFPPPSFVLRPSSSVLYLIIIPTAGLLGSLFDSFLGATVQAIYYCDFDHKETEARVHRCGRATRQIRGWRWLDNDGVNFAASVFGSVMAAVGYVLMG